MIEKIDITVWGRNFNLSVDYDVFEDEEVLQDQLDTFDIFASHPEWINDAKKHVEDYCMEKVAQDKSNDKKDNIFSYIKPDYLFVKNETRKHRIALMCKYRYDEEHGLAIVFNTQGEITVGSQDIIL